jgi:hypothetical protein
MAMHPITPYVVVSRVLNQPIAPTISRKSVFRFVGVRGAQQRRNG